MKLLILCTLFFTSWSVYGQEQSYIAYEKKADTLLSKIKSMTINEGDKEELRKIAYGFQNYSQQLDEAYHDYTNSLSYVNKAINYFAALGDSTDVANNKKFKGYLLGRLNRFPEAKAEIQMAIHLYQLKNKPAGVAVSQFDLCRVYDFEDKIDSAIYFCTISLNYWKTQSNPFRVINTQNMMIHLLTKQKDLENAKIIQENSEKLIADPKLHWQAIIDFYFVSMQLYKLVNEKTLADNYLKLYRDKVDELTKKNIIARSYFELSEK